MTAIYMYQLNSMQSTRNIIKNSPKAKNQEGCVERDVKSVQGGDQEMAVMIRLMAKN